MSSNLLNPAVPVQDTQLVPEVETELDPQAIQKGVASLIPKLRRSYEGEPAGLDAVESAVLEGLKMAGVNVSELSRVLRLLGRGNILHLETQKHWNIEEAMNATMRRTRKGVLLPNKTAAAELIGVTSRTMSNWTKPSN